MIVNLRASHQSIIMVLSMNFVHKTRAASQHTNVVVWPIRSCNQEPLQPDRLIHGQCPFMLVCSDFGGKVSILAALILTFSWNHLQPSCWILSWSRTSVVANLRVPPREPSGGERSCGCESGGLIGEWKWNVTITSSTTGVTWDFACYDHDSWIFMVDPN